MRQNATLEATVYDAAAFAQDANGRELQRGARVEIVASGERGRVRDVDGNYVVVEEDSGYSTRLAASGVRTMSNTGAVAMFTSATCPYCTKTVSMSRATLGEHRVPGGVCDGSGRAVVSMNVRGGAVFAQAFTWSDDLVRRCAEALRKSPAQVRSMPWYDLRDALVITNNENLAGEVVKTK